jgi:hypothetical protein
LAVLVGLISPLVGCLGALIDGGNVASSRIRVLAAVEAGGWLLGGLAVSTATRSRSGAATANPEDGPKQRPHDDQELAKTAKRSVHSVSKVERP